MGRHSRRFWRDKQKCPLGSTCRVWTWNCGRNDRIGAFIVTNTRGLIIIMIISRIITIIMITPDEELAEPVLALSKEEADEVADDT